MAKLRREEERRVIRSIRVMGGMFSLGGISEGSIPDLVAY
jgi:hypothetical protein